jgi:hypothetical protein
MTLPFMASRGSTESALGRLDGLGTRRQLSPAAGMPYVDAAMGHNPPPASQKRRLESFAV